MTSPLACFVFLTIIRFKFFSVCLGRCQTVSTGTYNMHELFGKFALSLLERTRIENSGQSDVFSAVTFVVLQCTVACVAGVERGRGLGGGKKGDASFSLRGRLLKAKGKDCCMSPSTPCLLFIEQITDFHSTNYRLDFVSFHFLSLHLVSQSTLSL